MQTTRPRRPIRHASRYAASPGHVVNAATEQDRDAARLRGEVQRQLVDAGYQIIARRRLPNKLGWQLQLYTGQVVSVFDTGTLAVQGVNPEPVKRVLRPFILPAPISNQREPERHPKKKKANHTLSGSTPLPASATSRTIRPGSAEPAMTVEEDRWGERTSYSFTMPDGEVIQYTTTPMETTAAYLQDICEYKIVTKVRRERHGRPGWLLKLSTGDAVWVDDKGPISVLSANQDLKSRLGRSTW